MDSDDSDEAHLAFLDENHQASDPLNVNQSSDEDDDDSSTTENTDKAKGASGNGRQVVNLADVLDFLRSLPSASKFVSSAAILTATAVDLADPTSPFALSLRRNAHIQHEAVRDEAGVATGEFLYAYQSKFNIKDKQGLINLINRCEDGVMYAGEGRGRGGERRMCVARVCCPLCFARVCGTRVCGHTCAFCSHMQSHPQT